MLYPDHNEVNPEVSRPAALSAETLAKILQVSIRHLRRLNATGRLPRPVRLGHSVRWLSTEIEAWLEAGAPDRKTFEAIQEAKS